MGEPKKTINTSVRIVAMDVPEFDHATGQATGTVERHYCAIWNDPHPSLAVRRDPKTGEPTGEKCDVYAASHRQLAVLVSGLTARGIEVTNGALPVAAKATPAPAK